MSIYFRSVMHKTPLESLRAFLRDVSTSAFEDVNWRAPRRSLVDVLTERILALDHAARDRIYSDVDRIGQLMNEHGRRVLRGVLPADPKVLNQFDALEDVTACALFVLMRKDDAFENALSAIYAQRLLNGRDWTGLDFEPGVQPKVRRDPPITDFEERLRRIFTAEGPVPRVAVDRFTRREPDPAGSGMQTREQFTIYVETAPEAELAFTGGARVEPRIVRRVQEGALLFDAEERTLDVVGKRADKVQRREIAEAFIEAVLEPGATLADRSRRMLALGKLKKRPRFDVRPQDRVRKVEVTRLALGASDFGAIATFEVRGRDEARDDLYQRAEQAFGRNGIHTHLGWPVIAARLRIEFEPERPKARAKSVTFELKAPDRTNLRDQIELHRQIADTLLARWGLYAAEE
jgi:hypothetical protein